VEVLLSEHLMYFGGNTAGVNALSALAPSRALTLSRHRNVESSKIFVHL